MVIAIAGLIGTGKSTIARALAVQLGGRYASFGEYVQLLISQHGVQENSRQVLQEIGNASVHADPVGFVDAFLKFAGYERSRLLIADGLRHDLIRAELARRCTDDGRRLVVIYLELAPHIRQQRLVARGLSTNAVSVIDSHPSEADVTAVLRSHADLVVDAALPVQSIVTAVERLISEGAIPQV